ncbi:STAS/SEC14 domain-containing protein [Kamptonema cortianum]|jgi:universal stress protein A|nr:STAS/SEC14 domain-containing protein [Geitlerinema splendidum]MDK3160894.1 STAS/SEC14 domain-containing protein [Kamptonema cortianum]
MIKISNTKKENVLHIHFEGTVTSEDYEKVLIPTLEQAIKAASPINVLCDMRAFKWLEFKAMVEDYKFGTTHLKDFDRMALVGDQRWLPFIIQFSNIFYKGIKLKRFKTTQLAAAKKWLEEK